MSFFSNAFKVRRNATRARFLRLNVAQIIIGLDTNLSVGLQNDTYFPSPYSLSPIQHGFFFSINLVLIFDGNFVDFVNDPIGCADAQQNAPGQPVHTACFGLSVCDRRMNLILPTGSESRVDFLP